MITKKNIKILIVIVLVAIGVATVMWISKKGGSDAGEASAYSAVYLTTGDVYFGKLSWFPHPHLTNVWLLQRGVDAQNKPQLGMTPFKSAIWSPVDEIKLSEKQIVFWAALKKDSQMVKAFENPQSVSQTQPVEGSPAGGLQNIPPSQLPK